MENPDIIDVPLDPEPVIEVIKNISLRNIEYDVMRRVRVVAANRHIPLGRVINQALKIGLVELEK